jgi:hypothetical protein
MKRIFKTRFHLGRGENFMKWRVENTETKDVKFFDPESYELKLTNCKLYNQKGSAKKIYDGGTKVVCAWIMSQKVDICIGGASHNLDKNRLTYNPKVSPNWMDTDNNNVDKIEYDSLVTIGRKLFKSE